MNKFTEEGLLESDARIAARDEMVNEIPLAPQPRLAAALAKAQGQMTAARFDKVNPHFRNRYASLASIIEAVRKPLSANGLAIMQMIRGDRLITRLEHASGAGCGQLL